jgi:hypothetical protein
MIVLISSPFRLLDTPPASGRVESTERAARAFGTLLVRLAHVVRRGTPDPPPGCYWVEPGRLLAGPYPGSLLDVAALSRLATLVVDLTEEGELEPYSELLEGVEWVRSPIRDFSAPSEEVMIRILDAIDAALARDERVYVHCRGGRGRTGTVLGCHLVRHGLTPETALARITELRRQLPDALDPSPETAAQVALVRGWRPGR